MRRSEASLALIHRSDGERRLLSQWNSRWQALSLVGGHRRAGESFRDCLLREIAEELELTPADYSAGAEPLVRLEYTAWSEGAGAETQYILEIFAVELRGTALERVSANPDNGWLTEEEVQAGRAADGRRVSPALTHILAGLPPAVVEQTKTA